MTVSVGSRIPNPHRDGFTFRSGRRRTAAAGSENPVLGESRRTNRAPKQVHCKKKSQRLRVSRCAQESFSQRRRTQAVTVVLRKSLSVEHVCHSYVTSFVQVSRPHARTYRVRR